MRETQADMLDQIPADLVGNTLLIQALIDQAGYTVAVQRKVAEMLGLIPFTKER